MTHPLTDRLPSEWRRRLRTGRQLLTARRQVIEDECLATGCAPLDEILAGGLRRGGLTELVGRGSSGRFALALGALAAVTQGGQAAALIDLGDGLSPHAAQHAGMVLERLLWVRPQRMKEALMAAESVISCGMPLVVLELGVPPILGGRGTEAFWVRLVRAAQSRRTAVLVSTPYRVTGTAAQVVVEAADRRAEWQGSGLQPRLLHRLSHRLRLLRSAEHRQARDHRVTLTHPSVIADDPPPKAAKTSGDTTPDAPKRALLTLTPPTEAIQKHKGGSRSNKRRKAHPDLAPDPLMTTPSSRAIA